MAVALAVAVAIGLLFFGSQIFAFMSGGQAAQTPTPVSDIATTTDTSSTQASMTQPIPQPLPTTLTVTDEVVGTGATAKAGDTVNVNYVGTLPDGTVFDASAKHGGPLSFQLGAGRVIKGWDEGVAGMKVGGKRQLIVPPGMGYGDQAVGNLIPANATLIFEVELIGIN